MILFLVDGVSRNAFEICEWSDDYNPSCFFGPSFPASQDDFYETMIEEEEEPIRS